MALITSNTAKGRAETPSPSLLEETIVAREVNLEGSLIANRRLYADANGKLVEEDDPSRLTLVAAGPGVRVSAADVERFGLTEETFAEKKSKKAEAPAEEEAAPAARSGRR